MAAPLGSAVVQQQQTLLEVAFNKTSALSSSLAASKAAEADLKERLQQANARLEQVTKEKQDLEEGLFRLKDAHKEEMNKLAVRFMAAEQEAAKNEERADSLQQQLDATTKTLKDKIKRLELQIAQDRFIAQRAGRG